ncbi:sulfotransferase [Oceanicola sp. D3]|uniref:sulfotransferase family protein n=1 Tax=Oceanicola sp. D3 TaxID=2587163 RepID=UPI00111E3547|nr:sulfotransferase [Oceanicola sp. D3]QDC11294.1 sulfotransferase [Oceanicola sp. D3]
MNTPAAIPGQKIANLFLVAAPRSGSTQLSAWLESHPDISSSPIKEPNYFSNHEFSEEYVREHQLNDVDPADYVARRKNYRMQFAVFRTPEQYSYLFEAMDTRWRLDASTTYLHCPEAADKIRATAPDAKIVILLRDPVARARSHYLLQHRIGRNVPQIARQLQLEQGGQLEIPGHFLLRPSEVTESVARYTRAFGNNALIVFAEDMFAHPQRILQRISAFLGLESAFDISVEAANGTALPRFHRLNEYLHSSGLLLLLRRQVPKSVKQRLSRVYYRKSDGDLISQLDEDALRAALQHQALAYEAMKNHAA